MEHLPKQKVLFLITKSNWGGAQRYVYDLATSLNPAEYEIVVALGGDGPLKQKLEVAGIRTISVPHLVRDISFSKELRSFLDIYRIIRAERPQVLHVNSSKAGGIGAFWGRLLRVPRVVYTAHGWAFNEDRSWLSRAVVGFFHWLTICFAHTTITVSDALQRQMRWPGVSGKLQTIHLGRSAPHVLNRAAARTALAAEQPALQPYVADVWLISVGELHPVKRHCDAIRAVKDLLPEYPTLRYCIIGDGQLRTSLAATIAELKLTEHVFLLGHLEDAAQYLRAADIFLFPSRSEALGYAALEAAQAGLPIVASNVGGIPEIVRDGECGTLVPPEDPAALAGAIRRYLAEPARANAHADAAQQRSQSFSIRRMVAATAAVYER